jgi:hypothetical protein
MYQYEKLFKIFGKKWEKKNMYTFHLCSWTGFLSHGYIPLTLYAEYNNIMIDVHLTFEKGIKTHI